MNSSWTLNKDNDNQDMMVEVDSKCMSVADDIYWINNVVHSKQRVTDTRKKLRLDIQMNSLSIPV
jgi:hypothetical protein